MIPKHHVEAYRSIHAPETLRDRVMRISPATNERRRVLPALLSAAAFLLIMGGTALLLGIGRKNDAEPISYCGLQMLKEGDDRRAFTVDIGCEVYVAGVRTDGLMLNVCVREAAELSVTMGAISVVGAEPAAYDMMDSVNINSDAVVFWNIDTENGLGAELILECAGKKTALTLSKTDDGITLEEMNGGAENGAFIPRLSPMPTKDQENSD